MRVSSDMPDDVIVLHDALSRLREYQRGPDWTNDQRLILDLKNCGTALRFLEVHLTRCYPGEPITLTGDARLMERKGKPTSQTTSALLMHGEDIPYSPDESPYITMTRKLMKSFSEQRERSFSETVLVRPGSGLSGVASLLEADWSAASFWYEYVAIHGGELLLEGLTDRSIQGDRVVADIYAEHFGVTTTFTSEGAILQAKPVLQQSGPSAKRSYSKAVSLNFERVPDLYPAIALTCERLGIKLIATGTERLRYKESDRLEAVRLHEVRNDHRIAMALMCADYPVGIEDQTCIVKSYPTFVEQLSTIHCQPSIAHITPIKGVNDDNLGKKHALSKLIHAATSDYVWLHDDDVVLPQAVNNLQFTMYNVQFDLLILPLRMESENAHPSLLERLQIAEYAAIQELTMRTAKQGRAVMCSGANLIVRREAWLACEADLHPEIPSGDDMFLLEAMKRRGLKIGVIDEPDYTAIVRPLTSWRAFLRQRMRWAGKAPHYTDPDIRRCGALIAAANILQLLCPPVILIKFPIEYSLIRKREPHTAWYVALLLEILYPFYLLISLIGGLFRRQEW